MAADFRTVAAFDILWYRLTATVALSVTDTDPGHGFGNGNGRKNMEAEKKRGRYERIQAQLEELFQKTNDPLARMATAAALLHAKMPGFFWTGWYLLRDGRLTVGPYQGPVACPVLPDHEGVCWTGVDRKETVIVPDVNDFPGHVACDGRSQSEIVVPVRDRQGNIQGVLDVDSTQLAHFDEVDAQGLESVVSGIYG